MRLAWFTPFGRKSAIGKYSQIVVDELQSDFSVEIFCPVLDDCHPSLVPVRAIEEFVNRADHFDLCIYNLGDNFEYHGQIFEVSQRHPGVVILHDFIMHHFFTGYFFLGKRDYDGYVAAMTRHYGEAGGAAASGSLQGLRRPVWESDEVVHFPFWEKAVEGARGVVVHSRFLQDKLLSRYPGPLQVIYFPACAGMEPSQGSSLEVDGGDRYPGKVVALTFGNINANKCVDQVIHILGRNPERFSNLIYLIVGEAPDQGYLHALQELVKHYSLECQVCFLGFQSDGDLQRLLARSDIILNLRFPAMEGASWSILEQLAAGKPVIVSDNGFYSEIPDDCVAKVSPFRERLDLKEALARLYNKPEYRTALGRNAREFYMKNFSTAKFCQKFKEFCVGVQSDYFLDNCLDKVGNAMSELSISPDMPQVEKVADIAADFFQLDCAPKR